MTIHAYTELRGPNPAYINVSERVHDARDVIVTVRSSGESDASSIILSRDQLRTLSSDVSKYLDATQLEASGLLPHQQRVVDEKSELDDRRNKLFVFFDTPTFAGLDEAEQHRMRTQHVAMKALSDVLGERIAAFAPA